MSSLSSISYPLEFDEVTGNLKMSVGSQVRSDNIVSLIETVIDERIMRPDYGTPLYLFEVIGNLNLVNYRIQQILDKYVPDISSKVSSSLNNGELLITVEWTYLLTPSVIFNPLQFVLQT